MITSVMEKIAMGMVYYDPTLYDRVAPYAGTALAGTAMGAGLGATLSHGVDRTVYSDALKDQERRVSSNMKSLKDEIAATKRELAPLKKKFDAGDMTYAQYRREAELAASKLPAKARTLAAARKMTPAMKTNFRRMGSWIGRGAIGGALGAGAMMLGDSLLNRNEWQQ